MRHFCITIHWLDDRYHGLLGREGPPEWPPSPFRVFQALIAGVARRAKLDEDLGKSLEWLQSTPETPRLPMIIAPRSWPGQVITRFVPNNDGDKVLDRQKRLTAKTSHQTVMLDKPEVHYVWSIDHDCPHEELIEASRLLSCLGWGIDMAYGDGRVLDNEEVERLSGVRWFPRPDTFRKERLLRIPNGGSMSDLRRAHESALGRLKHGRPLRTVHKAQEFDRVLYTNAEQPLGRPYTVFALRKADEEWYPYPHAKLIHMAGMTRSAAIRAMKECPPAGPTDPDRWVESFVAGHLPDGVEVHERFSYVPLPSIGHEHADAMIRRMMIVAPYGHEAQLRHLADQLNGAQLTSKDGAPGPLLDRINADSVTHQYLGPSTRWASVTPVILPGHDDHKLEKTIRLIRRALAQSGVEQMCEFTWRAAPNFPHCLTAHKYDRGGRPIGYFRPKYLQGLTAVHIRIEFEHPLAGPLSLGAGRHCGLGVLAVA